MTTNHEHLREVARKLSAPAYWFTAGFDERTGHWFSGSDAGHEGENSLPFEAAKVIIALLDELAALRKEKEALTVCDRVDADGTEHYWLDGIGDLIPSRHAFRFVNTLIKSMDENDRALIDNAACTAIGDSHE